MPLHHVRCGSGKPQLLAHRLGSTWQSWNPVLNRLADAREVVALDLPAHGETPPTGEATFAGLVEAVERFLRDENLDGVDAVGSSLGGRLVVELRPARAGRGDGDARSRRVLGEVGAHLPAHHARRRGSPGAAVPAAPAVAYRQRRQPRPAVRAVLRASREALAGAGVAGGPLHGPEPGLRRTPARPRRRPGPGGRAARGDPDAGGIVWGDKDCVTLPAQAARAQQRFPDARLHRFSDCGHFPQWDQPDETVRLMVETIGR